MFDGVRTFLAYSTFVTDTVTVVVHECRVYLVLTIALICDSVANYIEQLYRAHSDIYTYC